MKIEIEIEDAVYEAAKRYTLDPQKHLKTMLFAWQAAAQQLHPGVELVKVPTLAEQEAKRNAERVASEKEAVMKAAEVKRLSDAAETERKSELDAIAQQKEQEERIKLEARAMELAKVMMASVNLQK